MKLTNPEHRRKALTAALIAFENSLAEQDVWPGDYFARLEILGMALDELAEEHETRNAHVGQLGGSVCPTDKGAARY